MLKNIFGKIPLHTQLNTTSNSVSELFDKNFELFLIGFCIQIKNEIIDSAGKYRRRYFDVHTSRVNKEGDSWRKFLISYTGIPDFVTDDELVTIRKRLIAYFTESNDGEFIPLECTEEVSYEDRHVECFLRISWGNNVEVTTVETDEIV